MKQGWRTAKKYSETITKLPPFTHIIPREDVTVVMDVTLDPANSGSVQLQKRRGGSTTR